MTDEIKEKLTEIARTRLDVDTLETRSSDHLDFYDVGIWSIRNALLDAYELGKSQNK